MAKTSNGSPFLTTGERVRNFLGWAFVISIVGHLVFGPLIPFKQSHTEEQQVEKVSVEKKTKIKVPTPPPPTPTPKPTEPPKSTPPPKPVPHQVQPQLKVNLVHTKNSSNTGPTQSYVAPKTGSENGVPSGQATTAAGAGAPAAKPASTPRPACADPYREATMTNGVAPEYPEAAKQQGLGAVTVLVKITLSPGASVQSASVLQSSGNMSIDQAAMVAARQSSYAPKLVNCQPVEGTYSFRASFDPSQ